MANFERICFSRTILSLGFCTFLVVFCDCRPANEPGTTTHTRITTFPWVLARIANPCEVTPASRNVAQSGSTSIPTVSTGSSASTMSFHQSMESALNLALENLQTLQAADPGLPECNGISLDSLPPTPPLDALTEAETAKQAYATVIFLTAHFHLISLDRQVTAANDNTPVADDQIVPESNLPVWRFQRCGNETESFPTILQDVTTSLENILCTILRSATDEQTHTFRDPLNKLQKTILYRYHTSCSTLQTRDCLVIRNSKEALNMIARKYRQLIQDEDEIDNSI